MAKRRVLIFYLLLVWGVFLPAPARSDPLLEEQLYFLRIREGLRIIGELIALYRQRGITIATEKFEAERKRLKEAYDRFAQKIEGLDQGNSSALEEELSQAVIEFPDHPLTAILYLRLGEIYFHKAHRRFLEEMQEYDRALSLYLQGKSFKEPTFPEPDYSQVIEIYREFVESFPDHPMIEPALYLYGYILQESGREDEAQEVFLRLYNHNPRGPLAPEAAFRVGEFLFAGGEYEEAVSYYNYVLRSQDPDFYDKALYKLSWTYYKLKEYETAARMFVNTIDYGETSGSSLKASMRQESLQYLAVIFYESGGLEAMRRFFQSLGGRPYEIEAEIKLGEIYFAREEFPQAQRAYRAILDKFPLSLTAPEVARRLETCHLRMKDIPGYLATEITFVERFGPNSAWAKAMERQGSRLLTEIFREAEEKLFKVALYYHAEGQKASDSKEKGTLYARALTTYERLNILFPKGIHRTEAVFNQAEIYYDLKEWRKAGRLYQDLLEIEINPNHPLFISASWSMILAYRNALSEVESQPQQKSLLESWAKRRKELENQTPETAPVASTLPTRIEPLPLPEETQELLRAGDLFIRLYPLGPSTPPLLYTSADILFRYNHLLEAREIYETFMERFPDHPYLMDAIRQIARSYILLGDYRGLLSWGNRLYDSSLAQRNPEVHQYFTNILSGAMFKDTLLLLKPESAQIAAQRFEELIQRFPTSEYIDRALYNAAVGYQMYGDWDRSSELFIRFADRYPRDPLAPRALFQSAWNAEQVLDYPLAVSRYLEFLKRYPRAQETKDALYNAAILESKLGNSLHAAELFIRYIKEFPGSSDEGENLFYAAQAYADAHQDPMAEKLFLQYLRHPQKNEKEVIALYRLAKIEERRGMKDRYEKRLRELIATYDQYLKAGKIVDPRYAAEASFYFAKKLDEEYRAIRLTLPEKVLAQRLEKKAELFTQVEKLYIDVVKVGDPYWAMAALYQIGSGYKHMAESLFAVPLPPGLTEEEKEVYLQALEEQAFPFEDKAVQAWKNAIEWARSHGVVNEWTESSREGLLKLKTQVARFNKEERWVLSRSQFFYEFPYSTVTDAEVRIEGARVSYPHLAIRLENLELRYESVSALTPRKEYLLYQTIGDYRPLLPQGGSLPLSERSGLKATP